MMVARNKSLWSMAHGSPWVDAGDLAEALVEQVLRRDLDFRTRLLVRDSMDALETHWGSGRFRGWLAATPVREELESIRRDEELGGEPGFPSLKRRIMDKTDPETIRQFLRELGASLTKPLLVTVGGSAALILPELLVRVTDDVDVVDEVPQSIREKYDLLDELQQRFGLSVASFQSHFLPAGWAQRVHAQPTFARLQVHLVDPYDVLLSKLFSKRKKDLDDIRVVIPALSKDTFVRRFKSSADRLLADEQLRRQAEHNWYILFGEPLPT